MRSLLVGAAPAAQGSIETVATLAEAVGLVVAADGGAAHCLAAGVRPDVVCGDLDSIDPAVLAEAREGGARIRQVPVDKDVADLDVAIDIAREAGADRLVVTCVTGGRLDHGLAVIGSLARAADLLPEIVEPSLRVILLDPRARSEARVANGARFSLIALGESVVSVRGARWPVSHETIGSLSSRGLSNVADDEDAHVTVERGTLLVVVDERP